MNRKTILTLSTGLLIGFVAGLLSVQHIVPMLTAQEKKRQKPQDPVVRELHNIEAAISDRNSPVVKELENMSDELEEIAEMKRTLEKIERNMDWRPISPEVVRVRQVDAPIRLPRIHLKRSHKDHLVVLPARVPHQMSCVEYKLCVLQKIEGSYSLCAVTTRTKS